MVASNDYTYSDFGLFRYECRLALCQDGGRMDNYQCYYRSTFMGNVEIYMEEIIIKDNSYISHQMTNVTIIFL